jgi:hypothetical protein
MERRLVVPPGGLPGSGSGAAAGAEELASEVAGLRLQLVEALEELEARERELREAEQGVRGQQQKMQALSDQVGGPGPAPSCCPAWLGPSALPGAAGRQVQGSPVPACLLPSRLPTCLHRRPCRAAGQAAVPRPRHGGCRLEAAGRQPGEAAGGRQGGRRGLPGGQPGAQRGAAGAAPAGGRARGAAGQVRGDGAARRHRAGGPGRPARRRAGLWSAPCLPVCEGQPGARACSHAAPGPSGPSNPPLQIKHARAARQLEVAQASEASLTERSAALERDLADLAATSRARLHWVELAASDAGRRVEQLYAALQASAPLDAHQALAAKHEALQVGTALGAWSRPAVAAHPFCCVPHCRPPFAPLSAPQADFKRLVEERGQGAMDAEALLKLRDQLADMTLRFDKVRAPGRVGAAAAARCSVRMLRGWQCSAAPRGRPASVWHAMARLHAGVRPERRAAGAAAPGAAGGRQGRARPAGGAAAGPGGGAGARRQPGAPPGAAGGGGAAAVAVLPSLKAARTALQ